LKETGRRRPFWDGRLEDIKTRVMPVDGREGPGRIRIEELELSSFDQVRHVPRITGHFRVSLKELPRGVDNRSLDIGTPIVHAFVAFSAPLLTFFRNPCVCFLRVFVINDRGRVPAPRVFDAIDAARQGDAVFRLPGDVLYRGLARKVGSEEVGSADVLRKFLREGRTGHNQDECRHQESPAHAYSSKTAYVRTKYCQKRKFGASNLRDASAR